MSRKDALQIHPWILVCNITLALSIVGMLLSKPKQKRHGHTVRTCMDMDSLNKQSSRLRSSLLDGKAHYRNPIVLARRA